MNISVKVKTECGREEIFKKGEGLLEVHTKSKAKEGEANEAVIRIVAKYFGISAGDIAIVRGKNMRNKVLRMPDIIK